MKRVFIILAIALLTFQSCSENTVQLPNEIKFSMNKGLPTIMVSLNGRPAKLLIDSGAMSSVLNIDSAEQYDFDYRMMDGYSIGGVGGTAMAGIVTGARIEVDGQRLPIKFKCIDLSGIGRRIGIVGIIGSDYLDEHNYIIDYGTNTLKIKRE